MSHTAEKFEHWCIVEIFGHQKIAGQVSELTLGGETFIKIFVPETASHKAFTKLYGKGAIYCITPTTEQIVRLALKRMPIDPLVVYVPEIKDNTQPRLAGRDVKVYHNDNDEEIDEGEELEDF